MSVVNLRKAKRMNTIALRQLANMKFTRGGEFAGNELKHIFIQRGLFTSATTGPDVSVINAPTVKAGHSLSFGQIVRGTGISDRIGRKILARYTRISGRIRWPQVDQTDLVEGTHKAEVHPAIMFAIVHDTQHSGSTTGPDWGDVWRYFDNNGTSTPTQDTNVYALFRNPDNLERYKIVYQKRYMPPPPVVINGSTFQELYPAHRKVDVNINWAKYRHKNDPRGMGIQYTTDDADQGDLINNAFWVFSWRADTDLILAEQPKLTYGMKHSFED